MNETGDWDSLTKYMPELAAWLAEEGVDHIESTFGEGEFPNIGFSPFTQKWYGWSHRAVCGFSIGDEIKKGEIAYIPDTPEGIIEARVEFFSDFGQEYMDQIRAECALLPDGSGIRVLPSPMYIDMVDIGDEDDLKELAEDLVSGDMDALDSKTKRVDITADVFYEVKCGRGEWKAETLDDAKQMAIDFAKAVS